MMYIPESASLREATSETEKDFDILINLDAFLIIQRRNKRDETRDLRVNNTMRKTGGEEEREMGEKWTSPGLLYGSKITNLGFKSARNGTPLLVC